MEHWPGWLQSLMSVHITSGPLYTGIWLTTIIGLAALLIWQVLRTDRRRAWWQLLGAAAPGGAGLSSHGCCPTCSWYSASRSAGR